MFFHYDIEGKLKLESPYIDIQSVDDDSFIILRIKTALEKMLEFVDIGPQAPSNTFSVVGMSQRNGVISYLFNQGFTCYFADDEINDDDAGVFSDL